MNGKLNRLLSRGLILSFAAIMVAQNAHAGERKERSGRPVLYNLIVHADPIDGW